MKRFIIRLSYLWNNIWLESFEVCNNKNYIVTDETIFFTFVEGETMEEVQKDMYLLRLIGREQEIFFSERFKSLDCIYVVGREVIIDGMKFCYNPNLGCLIPISGNIKIY